jgi:hypothetical protein
MILPQRPRRCRFTDGLHRRKANLLKIPASGLTWDDIQRRVRRRHGR